MAALLLGATPDLDLQLVVARPDPVPRRPRARRRSPSSSTREFLDRLLEVRADLPAIRHVVAIEPLDAAGRRVVGRAARRRARSTSRPPPRPREPHDLATIIYTSGTTGPPKGVMLDHHNICWTVDSLREATRLRARPVADRVVPPDGAHRRTRRSRTTAGSRSRYEVTTCADIRLLGAMLAETQPQILFGVPRTFEKIHSTVQAVLAADAGPGRDVRGRARRSARRSPRTAARGEAVLGRARRPSTNGSTPSRCDRRVSCSGSTSCGSRSPRRRRSRSRCCSSSAARACRSRSSTDCRSRPGP